MISTIGDKSSQESNIFLNIQIKVLITFLLFEPFRDTTELFVVEKYGLRVEKSVIDLWNKLDKGDNSDLSDYEGDEELVQVAKRIE